jgi:hypothetical protein
MSEENEDLTPEDLDDEAQVEAKAKDEEGEGDEKPRKEAAKDDDEEGKHRRPGKRDRTTERVFGKLSNIERVLEKLPSLAERLEALEKNLADAAKRGDPKPKLSDFDSAEEYETAYDEWRERNPKGEKQPDKGGKENDRNEPQQPNPKAIAEALGVTLEVYEDFREQVDSVREEFEDYDEVMEESKSLLAASPRLTRELIEFGEDNGQTGPSLTYHLLKDREGRKEFRRIAALPSKREMGKALEAVAARLAEEPDEKADTRSDSRTEKTERRFTPLGARKAPGSKGRDESTMSLEEWWAAEEKRHGMR